jgi:hypothetical protein
MHGVGVGFPALRVTRAERLGELFFYQRKFFDFYLVNLVGQRYYSPSTSPIHLIYRAQCVRRRFVRIMRQIFCSGRDHPDSTLVVFFAPRGQCFGGLLSLAVSRRCGIRRCDRSCFSRRNLVALYVLVGSYTPTNNSLAG